MSRAGSCLTPVPPLSMLVAAGECPRGSFCPPGSSSPRRCPAGRFGAVKGLGDAHCSGGCEAGYRCPEGADSPRSGRQAGSHAAQSQT